VEGVYNLFVSKEKRRSEIRELSEQRMIKAKELH
jgi:hypothetical protein